MQDIHDEYLHTVEEMLSLGKLRLIDIYPIVRIIRPHFYGIALKASNHISKERFLEDMQLLSQDITNFENMWSSYTSYESQLDKKQEMINIFFHYLSKNQFKDDSDVEQFKDSTSKLHL